MTVTIDTIPPSTRKPGAYFEFNTALAVRTLPANNQRLLLVVPLLDKGTLEAHVPLQVYGAADAFAATGSALAKAMVAAAIKANRYLDLSIIGVAVERDDSEAPDIAPALDTILAAKYDLVVSAWQDKATLVTLRTHIAAATDSINQQSRIGVAAVTTTLSAATTLATDLDDGTTASGSISIPCLPGAPDAPAVVAAVFAAVIASESDPARPLNTLPLTGLAVPPIAARLGRNEQEVALANGVTPLEVGPGDVVQIVRAISIHTKSANGADDVALLDLTTMRTLYYVREACRTRIRLRFPRAKLFDRMLPSVRSELLDVLMKCEELEIVENVAAVADQLIVERSLQDANRINAAIPADVVNGLHVFAGRIDLLL